MAIQTAPSHRTRARVFTEYVASLGASGEPPDRESFERAWRTLKGALRNELRRRGLWSSPPTYLGVVGADAWTEEALDELVGDAYVFNFVHRLRSLRAQLQVKPNLEGLVRLNLKNFLYERQRRHDPLGHRLFGTVRTALKELLDAGGLELAGGDPGIRNDTVLRFPDAPPEEGGDRPGTGRRGLDGLVAPWSDALLPELVTARGRRKEEVAAALRRRIEELRDQGIAGFTVKELVDPLKDAVRERWRALHIVAEAEGTPREPDEPDELFAETRRTYRPDDEVEDAEAFEKLTACVERHLHDLDTDPQRREYLHALWQFLRLHAAGERELPSRRKLGASLGIPRNRFPELYGTLRDALERCRRLLLRPQDREGRIRAHG
ncbi:MAG: hypothetical protein ACLF0P_01725 [Thermoanaerobaculia bacterium]